MVERAGLLCIYTLATVLGLFLHTPDEAAARLGLTTRGGRPRTSERSAAAAPADLVSKLARIALALPEPPAAAEHPPLVHSGEVPAGHGPHLVRISKQKPRSRAPPIALAA